MVWQAAAPAPAVAVRALERRSRHRFTPVLTRKGDPHTYCVEWSTALERWEGQAGAREYRFAAREVGEALVSVAKGTSYRVAAEIAWQKQGGFRLVRGVGAALLIAARRMAI